MVSTDHHYDIESEMLVLQALAPYGDVCLRLSENKSWYVDLRSVYLHTFEGMLASVSGFAHTPQAAIHNVFATLTAVRPDEYVVTLFPTRKHWRWNGAAFKEVQQ